MICQSCGDARVPCRASELEIGSQAVPFLTVVRWDSRLVCADAMACFSASTSASFWAVRFSRSCGTLYMSEASHTIHVVHQASSMMTERPVCWVLPMDTISGAQIW